MRDREDGSDGRPRRLPRHSTVVAYLALFVAIGGGSFAVAALSGKEKKVVKRIAGKQVDKRVSAFDLSGPANGSTPSTRIGELEIEQFCFPGGGGSTDVIFWNRGPSTPTLNWIYSDGSPAVIATGEFLAPEGGNRAFPFKGKRIEGQFIFSSPRAIVTVNLHAYSDGGSSCEVHGTAQRVPTP